MTIKNIGMDTNWPTISNNKTFYYMSATQKLQNFVYRYLVTKFEELCALINS